MPAPVITPSATDYRAADTLPTPYPEFTSDQPVRWTATHGSLLTSVSPRVAYNGTDYRANIFLEPANEYRLVTVTGTNASAEAGGSAVQVTGTWPVTPDFGLEVEEEEPADKFYAPDKRTFTCRYNGDPVQKWSLVHVGRRLADRTKAKAFRAYHRVDKPFYLDDQVLGELTLVVADSGLKTTGQRLNLIDFSIVVREY